jgi:hypothetical protein
MTRSADFSAYFVTRWRDGAMPRGRIGNTIVNCDQSNIAYDIAADDMTDFIEWVANNWESDNDPRDISGEDMILEPAEDYLNRRGISIRTA